MERRLSLNKASKEDLEKVEGIGDHLADTIVRFRQEHGRFKSKDDIDQIPGFSRIRTEKLKNAVDL